MHPTLGTHSSMFQTLIFGIKKKLENELSEVIVLIKYRLS